MRSLSEICRVLVYGMALWPCHRGPRSVKRMCRGHIRSVGLARLNGQGKPADEWYNVKRHQNRYEGPLRLIALQSGYPPALS